MPKVVISASRRTDIPAFYMPWFMDCIHNSVFKIINPFNQRASLLPVSPDRVHTIVFWSKNFGPFIRHGYADALTQLGYRLFFNFTINAPHPILEPSMPPLETRLEQMVKLARIFDPGCIQWRFDPICFFTDREGRESNNLDGFNAIARRIANIGIHTCITSFADLYRKVMRRLKKNTEMTLYDPPIAKKVEVIASMQKKLTSLDMDLRLCCEKDVLAALPADVPTTASSCIPNDLLMERFGPGIPLARDGGQRRIAGCRCHLSKDVGSYNLHPCGHNCLFCYANPAIDSQ